MSRSLEAHTLKNTTELTVDVHQSYGLAVARAQLKCWRKLILMRDRARDGERAHEIGSGGRFGAKPLFATPTKTQLVGDGVRPWKQK